MVSKNIRLLSPQSWEEQLLPLDEHKVSSSKLFHPWLRLHFDVAFPWWFSFVWLENVDQPGYCPGTILLTAQPSSLGVLRNLWTKKAQLSGLKPITIVFLKCIIPQLCNSPHKAMCLQHYPRAHWASFFSSDSIVSENLNPENSLLRPKLYLPWLSMSIPEDCGKRYITV